MKLSSLRFLSIVALIGVLPVTNVHSAIQLSSTRLILEEGKRSAAVYAKNKGEPVVVQAWVEGVGEKMETPFFITPPLSRFDGDTERSLTVTRVGENVPQDRETYYWINVLEIPQKAESAANTLAFATRTRIKLFYRPSSILRMSLAPEQLSWKIVRDGKKCQVSIDNSSPFNVNFSKIELSGQTQDVGRGVVALPLTTTQFDLSTCPAAGATMTPQIVNDYGAFVVWPAVTPQVVSGGDDAARKK